MSFFATPLNPRVGAGLAALASAAGFAAAYLPHTVYIDKYKDVVHFHQNGFHLPLNDELKERVQSTLRDVKMNENLKKYVTFFHVATLDPFFAGTPESGHGAIIGIPVTFTYKSVRDVPIQELGIIGADNQVQWDSPAGRLLKESFVFPPEAQKYAIAQQIYMANSNHVTVGAAVFTWNVSVSIRRDMKFQIIHYKRCLPFPISVELSDSDRDCSEYLPDR